MEECEQTLPEPKVSWIKEVWNQDEVHGKRRFARKYYQLRMKEHPEFRQRMLIFARERNKKKGAVKVYVKSPRGPARIDPSISLGLTDSLLALSEPLFRVLGEESI